jgi:transcriptional regulator with XRE-family HTH domain
MATARTVGHKAAMTRHPSFRERFVSALDTSGMTMAELSRRSGVSYQVIDKLKKGRISSTTVENAQRLSIALGMDSNYSDQTHLALSLFLSLSQEKQDLAIKMLRALAA